MANKKKKNRKRFLEVDVWRKEFGPVSVRAIYDVFAQKFDIKTEDMKNYQFPDCVNALRKLEDPNYEPPKDQSSY